MNRKIQEVLRVAAKYYGVDLSPEQARHLIRSSKPLARELSLGGGYLDTLGRDCLCDTLVETVFAGHEKPQHVDWLLGGEFLGWHWPANGSSDDYKQEFFQEFQNAAESKGFTLIRALWRRHKTGAV